MKEEQKWIVILNRRSTIFFHNLVVKGQGRKYYREMYDIDFEVRNFRYVNGEVTIGLSDLMELGALLGRRMRESPRCLGEFLKKGYSQCDRLLKVSRRILALRNIENKNNQELARWYDRYLEEVLPMMPSLIATPTIERSLEEKITKGLKETLQSLGKEEPPEHYLDDLIFARKDNYVVQELDELLGIAAEVQKNVRLLRVFQAETPETILKQLAEKNRSLLSKIIAHTKRFGFLNMYCYEGTPMTNEDVVLKLKELLGEDCAKKLEAAKKAKREVMRRYQKLLRELRIGGALLRAVEYTQEYLYFRLYRLDVLMKAGYYVRGFIAEIARRMGITYDDTIHLWHEEVKGFLESGRLPDMTKIMERKEKYATLLVDGEFRVFSGKEVEGVVLREETPKAELGAPVTMLEGNTASRGRYEGAVRLVLVGKDVDKVRKGDVLVSTMTNPYYLLAMMRAKAIVCDEGGILSHAAIVSRELGIPCVVGTKNATKVLKDGDLVEVNASGERGTVRILERGGLR